ncbi:hypothetical protein D3P08_04990 [Paenibacillus nanensis]|uniref:Uncharacterized protein n=1 Tax=Paenibacillus nanensis TaxID=393251 RepID=A0A3A1VIG8_9BACL|nr:hypothetical protein [Paenibacillus nanensis]RIX59502.1 hypothetical protein D3P08_04990 [Paenibacillus nanensis]
MRYTVQYIPLSKLKPGISVQLTKRIKELRKAAQDCMHLMIVRKSRKAGGYVIISGNHHFDYFKKHTRKAVAPCLVDESKALEGLHSLIHRMRKRKLPYEVPILKRERTPASSWTIIRRFLKQEPRFKQLSRRQQVKVLRLGLQYKKTTMLSMKAMVDDIVNRNKTG